MVSWALLEGVRSQNSIAQGISLTSEGAEANLVVRKS